MHVHMLARESSQQEQMDSSCYRFLIRSFHIMTYRCISLCRSFLLRADQDGNIAHCLKEYAMICAMIDRDIAQCFNENAMICNDPKWSAMISAMIRNELQ